MSKTRLDQALVQREHLQSRSQAESYIKLGKVLVGGKVITKPGYAVAHHDKIELLQKELYVSRAGLKLAGAAEKLELDFGDKLVLDVGSSTGGFTDYALRRGAKKVIAVDIGTNQLHASLRDDSRIELHEKTDVRSLRLKNPESRIQNPEKLNSQFTILNSAPDLVLIDVSFISLREVLPAVKRLSKTSTQILAMVKPQFEAGKQQINRGVVKNDTVRRKILDEFATWAKSNFLIAGKADSEISGARGNRERFYLLRIIK